MRKSLGNNTAVVQAWAKGSQPEGHSGSLSFIGEDLYSYQTIIGRKVNGMTVLSAVKYSTTTARHISEAYSASYNIVFVDYPGDTPYENKYYASKRIDQFLIKARKARQLKDTHIEAAHKVARDFNRYAKALGEGDRGFNLADIKL